MLENWRLQNDDGVQKWIYLDDRERRAQWPLTIADKYYLGFRLPVTSLPPAKSPLDVATNALTFFEKLQWPCGNWACEYGGPMFLMPGVVLAWYCTNTPIPASHACEIKKYLLSRQNPADHGWGLHIEGESSVYGTLMTYIVLRILGSKPNDRPLIQARQCLHGLGGASHAPHWAKFWLGATGLASWDIVNPVPPELWLLPYWVPFHPARWWIHVRQPFLAMSYVYSRRWQCKPAPLLEELRNEIYVEPFETVNFAAERNTICDRDNYHPKSLLLNIINWLLVNVWNPYLRAASIAVRAEAWVLKLIRIEDDNTLYRDLAPVSGALNFLACYIADGPDAPSVAQHRETVHEFLWMTPKGMLANGTNGVQTWDTSFLIQAVCEAGLASEPRWHNMLLKALGFLDRQQILEEIPNNLQGYRQRRLGAWAFSNKQQGYTVADTTSEAMKAILLLQAEPGFPILVDRDRFRLAVDTILTMQNRTGGFGSYEPARAGEWMEQLNAAEVFGRIMVEYDYPELTNAVITGCSIFRRLDPAYRAADIDHMLSRALKYIHASQQPNHMWYGAWGVCFLYGTMFALEALALNGETYESSTAVRRACDAIIAHRLEDGAWGESYKACETVRWIDNPNGSQVVGTCWAVIALLHGKYPDRAPLAKALRVIAKRQQENGEFLQESIEGVFNKSCMISYPNYKFYFPIKAFGMYAKRYGNAPL